jgi:hypothetical protein
MTPQHPGFTQFWHALDRALRSQGLPGAHLGMARACWEAALREAVQHRADQLQIIKDREAMAQAMADIAAIDPTKEA